jgi:small nuclear ribonucleoprotein F
MNLHLTKAEEFLDGQFAGYLGEILIRCNNVLYVTAIPAEEQGESSTEKAEAQPMETEATA